MQYTQDYDEHYPCVRIWDGQHAWEWRYSNFPYVKSYQVFACPSNPSAINYWNGDCVGGNIEPNNWSRSYYYATNNGDTPPSWGFSYAQNSSANESIVLQPAQKLSSSSKTEAVALTCAGGAVPTCAFTAAWRTSSSATDTPKP